MAANPAAVAGTAQTERPAILIGAAGAADAVDVDFRVGRHIDVDHRFQLGDVQPARGDIGGHQHRAAAVGELDQHLIAFALFQVAVQGQRMKPLLAQDIEQIAALLLGVAEGQRADRAVVLEQGGHRLQTLFIARLRRSAGESCFRHAVRAASLPAA
jgi:hypothetical protein